MSTRPNPTYIGFIDGLRGLSALWVVLGHVWQFAIAGHEANPLWFKVFSVLKYGNIAVGVFIVISGYCLMLPVLTSPDTKLRGGVVAFIGRRISRILPPYYAAVALSVLAVIAWPRLQVESGTPWDITLPSSTAGAVLSHLAFVHNWSEQWRWALDPPLWTVALELQIYGVFAFLLLPLWRRGGPVLVIGSSLVLSLLLAVAGFGYVYPWMLVLFAFGMTAAAISQPDAARGTRLRDRSPITATAVLALSVLVVVVVLEPLIWHSFAFDLAVGLSSAILITSLTIERDNGRLRPIVQALEFRPVMLLGACSYSLYLIHYPIVAIVSLALVHNRGLSAPQEFVLLGGIAIPLSLATAWAFYLAVERPFMSRTRRAIVTRASALETQVVSA